MISPEEMILRLAVAAVLGGLVGLERERLEWAAGMRTHALVSLGSATLLALALLVLAKPLKARIFPNRKEARRVRLVVERGTPLAELREEVEASEVPLERIVVRRVRPRRRTRRS